MIGELLGIFRQVRSPFKNLRSTDEPHMCGGRGLQRSLVCGSGGGPERRFMCVFVGVHTGAVCVWCEGSTAEPPVWCDDSKAEPRVWCEGSTEETCVCGVRGPQLSPVCVCGVGCQQLSLVCGVRVHS